MSLKQSLLILIAAGCITLSAQAAPAMCQASGETVPCPVPDASKHYIRGYEAGATDAEMNYESDYSSHQEEYDRYSEPGYAQGYEDGFNGLHGGVHGGMGGRYSD